MPASIIIIRPTLSEPGFGIRTGTALFSDGVSARFQVLNADPPAVTHSRQRAMPEHERAIEEWLADQGGPEAA
jgi:hypothetical protein